MRIAFPRELPSFEALATLLVTGALGLALVGLGTPRLVSALGGPSAADNSTGSAARQHLEASLARAPADPAGWAALAELDLAESGASGTAPRALALSLLTGPDEPGLLWRRVELGLTLWPSLAESERALMDGQLRQAWERDPARLAALAQRAGAADPIRGALADRPEALQRFNLLLGAP
ncbi:MAG: hypothetical protein JO255_21415 [Alphaproteobacteria bacterium]|nr:hypothetical protein [Alphaproteobacteria bacterium]